MSVKIKIKISFILRAAQFNKD